MKESSGARRILLVDDDPDLSLLLKGFLGRKGYTVETAGRKKQAMDHLEAGGFDLVLCDHRLPDTDSLEMLRICKRHLPKAPVIVITGYSDVRIAVELMRLGAHDYVVKPLYPDDIALRIEEALEERAPQAEVKRTRPARKEPGSNGSDTAPTTRRFVHGKGPQAKELAGHIALVAPTDLSVLILGETGTGKEFVAREIHQNSQRNEGPFVALDCGAIPTDLAGSVLFGHVKGAFTGALNDTDGCFVQAHGGTLFLDEVGNLSHEDQMKLLRVLQERVVRRIGGTKDQAVDVRIISATNEDLKKGRASEGFREDLYHRLNEFSFGLLPLRERPDDILHYAEHFLGLASVRLGRNVERISAAAQERLRAHPWPGNLRELNNVIKRAVLLCKGNEIGVEELPSELTARVATTTSAVPQDRDLRGATQHAEKQAIIDALQQHRFNKTRTAAALNIDRKTLYNKLKAFGIDL